MIPVQNKAFSVLLTFYLLLYLFLQKINCNFAKSSPTYAQVIYVPVGNNEDHTRKCEFYNGTYEYLKDLCIKEI